MGNQHTSDEFNTSDWTKIGTESNFITLWQNKHNPCIHIEQYPINAKNQEQLNLQRQFYFQRKNHPYWIAAYYFQQSNNSTGCMLGNAAHIYIQKIPITICDLRELTLSDLIHIYSQCLQGFKTLAQILGYFRVYEKYIGINERGIVKVWAGYQWSKVGVILNQATEEEMVESILYCLQKLSFGSIHQLPSLNGFMHRNNLKLTFSLALQELRNFALAFNKGIIPNRIQILYNAPYLDPLVRSKHHLLRQSKFIPSSQASNSSLYKYPKKDQNRMAKIKEIKEQSKSLKKLNNPKNSKSSFNLFSCMSVQQRKTSKLFTKQEIIKHYADLYQTDELQEKSKNNYLFQQNTSLLSYNMKNDSKCNPQNHFSIQRLDLKQVQRYYFPNQHKTNRPYSFHPLLKQQQQACNRNPQMNGDKPKYPLHKSDNYAQRARGKSLGMNSQKQFIRFIPQYSIKSLNNKTSQMSSQMSGYFQPQKNYILNNHMDTTQSKTNIHYHNDITIRNPLNILQPNIHGHCKFEYRTGVQRIYI